MEDLEGESCCLVGEGRGFVGEVGGGVWTTFEEEEEEDMFAGAGRFIIRRTSATNDASSTISFVRLRPPSLVLVAEIESM